MKVFINDKPVSIKNFDGQQIPKKYDAIISGKDEIISKKLVGDVLIEGATTSHIERLLKILEIKKLRKLKSLTLSVANKELTEEFIKDQFKIIRAAGGLVLKDDKVLMIYRLKKWDLPKGKLDKKEDTDKAAKREVEEECKVKVEVKEKLCSTWHTYIRKDSRILKKTDWYVMNCLSDKDMAPQIEEHIEELKWMTKKEVKKALTNSYKSIERVFEKYYPEDKSLKI